MNVSSNKREFRKSVLIISVILIGMSSCLKHKTIEPVEPIVNLDCPDTISFNQTILPELFMPNCVISGCHDASSASSGYVFDSHSVVSQNATKIFNAISHNSGITAMPYGGNKLNDSLITKFDCWIQQGMLNN